MTQRTDNHKIFSFIVFPIFINMMNAKNFFYFLISTFFAFFYQSFFKHFFSYCSKFGMPLRSFRFTCARFGTKFTLFTRRIKKFYSTMLAIKFFISSVYLRPMIAKSRTIFCFVATRRNVFKNFITDLAVCFDRYCIGFVLTYSRTIFKSFNSVFRHVALFATCETFNIKGFSHASP